jgi:hypothetical protein
MRRDVEAVARMMGLPQPRIELMLHRAMRAIPLVADQAPVTVLTLHISVVSCGTTNMVLALCDCMTLSFVCSHHGT